jgi:hypothetical protein
LKEPYLVNAIFYLDLFYLVAITFSAVFSAVKYCPDHLFTLDTGYEGLQFILKNGSHFGKRGTSSTRRKLGLR